MCPRQICSKNAGVFLFFLCRIFSVFGGEGENFEFFGSQRWAEDDRELCEQSTYTAAYSDFICTLKLSKTLLPVKIELLNFKPLVILFHAFATTSEYSNLLEVSRSELLPAEVQTENGEAVFDLGLGLHRLDGLFMDAD